MAWLPLGLFDWEDGFEEPCKHAGGGEQGEDGLDVLVQEAVDGDPQPPLVLELLELLKDLVVAVADVQVRGEPLEALFGKVWFLTGPDFGRAW